MLRCVSKINPVRLQFVCCLQRLWSLGWAAPAIWSNMQCHIGPRWGPQRHGHKFRRACVRRGLANCQTYMLKRSLDARPAHIIYLITLFQTLSYPGSPHSTLLLVTFDGSARIAKTGKAIDDQAWAWASARDHRNQSQFTPNVVAVVVVVDRPWCPIRCRVALSLFLVVKDKQIVCL